MDDRLYETGFPDIIMESEIIPQLQYIPFSKNMHSAFLKICYYLIKKMGLEWNQRELKDYCSYCWCSSAIDNVFYIDHELKTYRCTYTVGREKYSLFDFSIENLENFKIPLRTYHYYPECRNCNLRGYCCGGCQLSHDVNYQRCCQYEKETFSYFLKTTFLPYIRLKLNEVKECENNAEIRLP